MNRSVPKKKKMGYALFINRSSEPKGWERVGFLFGSSGEANSYRQHRYEDVKRWSIQAVRVSPTPLVREHDSEENMQYLKKGVPGAR